MRALAVKKLADCGPLQLSLFDQQGVAEITPPDFLGERLVTAAPRPWPPTAPPDLLAATKNCSPPSSPESRPGNSPSRRVDRRRSRQGDQEVQDRRALRRHRHHLDSGAARTQFDAVIAGQNEQSVR
jgi:hypothetical protein